MLGVIGSRVWSTPVAEHPLAECPCVRRRRDEARPAAASSQLSGASATPPSIALCSLSPTSALSGGQSQGGAGAGAAAVFPAPAPPGAPRDIQPPAALDVVAASVAAANFFQDDVALSGGSQAALRPAASSAAVSHAHLAGHVSPAVEQWLAACRIVYLRVELADAAARAATDAGTRARGDDGGCVALLDRLAAVAYPRIVYLLSFCGCGSPVFSVASSLGLSATSPATDGIDDEAARTTCAQAALSLADLQRHCDSGGLSPTRGASSSGGGEPVSISGIDVAVWTHVSTIIHGRRGRPADSTTKRQRR